MSRTLNPHTTTTTLRHLLAGTRNMSSQKGKRAKGVQMTEQQPKTPQIIDIVEMPPTVDIVQSPPTQNGSQTPDTAQIEDILQMAAQMVDIQPLKRALGGNIYLELTKWNGSKISKSKRQKQKQNECMMNILNTDAQKHNKRTK